MACCVRAWEGIGVCKLPPATSGRLADPPASPCCCPPTAAAVSVRHCLLALPGVQKGDIKRVLSHPQALAQTDSYTRRMPGVVREAVDDTGERRTSPAQPCPALPSPALPSPALPCPVAACVAWPWTTTLTEDRPAMVCPNLRD